MTRTRATAGLLAVGLIVGLTASGAEGNAGGHPADKRKAAKRERCGRYNSTSGYAKARVTAIRGVDCDEALYVARKFDRRGEESPPWECFLARGGGRALFSCGYGGTSGDVRDFPHALVARGVGGRDD